MSANTTQPTLWERSLMGCACHAVELECPSCEAYLYHVSTSWGANEKGLRDIIKTNNNVPQLQAQLSAMETKLSSLAPSIARIANLEDQIRHLTDERDSATKSVTQLEAKISMIEEESLSGDSVTQPNHLDEVRLLTAERDGAMESLKRERELSHEQIERNRFLASKSEASDARCSSLVEANSVLIQERSDSNSQISRLQNEIEVLVLKSKDISNAHAHIKEELQDERLRTADLRETIRHLKDKIAQSEVESTTDDLDKRYISIQELGGKSDFQKRADDNDDLREERNIGIQLDASHYNVQHVSNYDIHDGESNSRTSHKRPRYSSPEPHDTDLGASSLRNFDMRATPPPSPLCMGPIIPDYPMLELSPNATSNFNDNPRSPKIAPIVAPRINPVNHEWRIPPSWVPECAHVSLVDGKWRAGSDKEDALRNEALDLPPLGDPPFGSGFPRTTEQVKEYMDLAHQRGQHLALAYVISWVQATQKIPPSQFFPWMPYLRHNWRRPQWIKDQHPDAVRSRPGSGHVARRRENKFVDVVRRPSWDAPIEDWGHYFWSSPKTVRTTHGIRLPKNNAGIKLRQVRGYILIAPRAPIDDTTRGIWYRACAELLAFPRRYESYISNGLHISKERIMEPANATSAYTDRLAARELARQGVTVDEVHDAQPYGFFWLIDNMRHPTMGGPIRGLVEEINKIPTQDVDTIPRFEPQVYPEPSTVLTSDYNPSNASTSKATASRESASSDDDGADDYDFYA